MTSLYIHPSRPLPGPVARLMLARSTPLRAQHPASLLTTPTKRTPNLNMSQNLPLVAGMFGPQVHSDPCRPCRPHHRSFPTAASLNLPVSLLDLSQRANQQKSFRSQPTPLISFKQFKDTSLVYANSKRRRQLRQFALASLRHNQRLQHPQRPQCLQHLLLGRV